MLLIYNTVAKVVMSTGTAVVNCEDVRAAGNVGEVGVVNSKLRRGKKKGSS